MISKIVYQDGPTTKVLWGTYTEDDGWLTVETTQGKTFKLNKKYIVAIREGDVNEDEYR